ncbi:hypothetical protein KI387_001709, partial [Taxus chinensis]
MTSEKIDDNVLAGRAFARTGIDHMFGIMGIPVTSFANNTVKEGIRFIAFHNEHSAGYAVSAYGYLTGKPGLRLTVSGL